jgi:hypothetical protein
MKNCFSCELTIDKFRFYYEIEIEEDKIYISNVRYQGRVIVLKVNRSHKAGSYGHHGRQQKDINKMKKNFRKDKK